MKQCGRVCSNPTSYSGDPGFKPWVHILTILTEVFRYLLQSLQANSRAVPQDQVTAVSFNILSNLLLNNHNKIRRRTDVRMTTQKKATLFSSNICPLTAPQQEADCKWAAHPHASVLYRPRRVQEATTSSCQMKHILYKSRALRSRIRLQLRLHCLRRTTNHVIQTVEPHSSELCTSPPIC
jgi:hypothetical protein